MEKIEGFDYVVLKTYHCNKLGYDCLVLKLLDKQIKELNKKIKGLRRKK